MASIPWGKRRAINTKGEVPFREPRPVLFDTLSPPLVILSAAKNLASLDPSPLAQDDTALSIRSWAVSAAQRSTYNQVTRSAGRT